MTRLTVFLHIYLLCYFATSKAQIQLDLEVEEPAAYLSDGQIQADLAASSIAQTNETEQGAQGSEQANQTQN